VTGFGSGEGASSLIYVLARWERFRVRWTCGRRGFRRYLRLGRMVDWVINVFVALSIEEIFCTYFTCLEWR